MHTLMTTKAELTDAACESFRQRGWVVVEGVFSAAEADAVAELATRLCDEELATAGASSSDAADYSADGRAIPRKLIKPFLKHADLRAFALDRRLQSLVDRLIGKPALLGSDQIFMKPPRFGSAKPYHQDNAYFLCEPADELITAWIALDDVDESNGCLRYIDGSHKGPILEHIPVPGEPHNRAPDPREIDLTKERLACVRKAGVVFHHGKTLHTSHRNESDRWRRGYATHWVSRDVTSRSEFIHEAYFIRHRQSYDEALASRLNGTTP